MKLYTVYLKSGMAIDLPCTSCQEDPNAEWLKFFLEDEQIGKFWISEIAGYFLAKGKLGA